MMGRHFNARQAVMRIRRIMHFSRTNGWKKGLYRLWYGLSRRLLGRFAGLTIVELMAAPVTALRQLERLPKGLHVYGLESTEIAQIEHLVGQPGKATRRYAAGDECLVALSGGEVLATEWIKFGPSAYEEDQEDLGVVFRVPAHACWLYDGKTVNAEQVVGPWGAVMGRLRAYLEPRGVQVAYLQVGYHNQYSIRCHEALGFRSIGRLCCARVAGVRWIWRATLDGKWASVRGDEYRLENLPLSSLQKQQRTDADEKLGGPTVNARTPIGGARNAPIRGGSCP